MRTAIAMIIIILPVFTLSCASSQQAPTQDLLATVDAMVEATKEADRAVSATIQATLEEQSAHDPTATTSPTPAPTKVMATPEENEPTTADSPATPEIPTGDTPTLPAPRQPTSTVPYVPPTLEPRSETPTPTSVPGPTSTAPPPATEPGVPTATPYPEETAENPQPEPTVEQPTREPETGGMYVYRDPQGVFTFSYPADCGRMMESTGPDGSRVAGNEKNCPGNDGEIDVELETSDLTEDQEELPLSPESAAKQVANALADLTHDAHRQTLTTGSGDTVEVVRNEVEAWGDEKIVLVTAIHVSADWQATDIIMSYWASGEEDPNWDRILESLQTFSTGVKDRN